MVHLKLLPKKQRRKRTPLACFPPQGGGKLQTRALPRTGPLVSVRGVNIKGIILYGAI